MSIHIIQSDKWPFHVTLVNTDKTLNLFIELAELGSKDTLQEANARPANITLLAHLKLFAAAPDMYELLTRVATSTNSGYGSMMSAAALADTLRDLSSQAKQLMAKIEGGGE